MMANVIYLCLLILVNFNFDDHGNNYCNGGMDDNVNRDKKPQQQ